MPDAAATTRTPGSSIPPDDLLCFSHLRWNFVFQRPQHLLTRFARERRVFFFEEPIFDAGEPHLDISIQDGVWVVEPHLPMGDATRGIERLAGLLDQLILGYHITRPIVWYYTPMALEFTRHLTAKAIVFDCMDDLSASANAPPGLLAHEEELLHRATLVFTAGQGLYEAKRTRHPHVYLFPSSIDAAHFRRARARQAAPIDQASVPCPRLGFFGVVDERLDIDLLSRLAELRPSWHLMIVGPVVKIDPANLPRLENIHYVGMKSYTQLPAFLSGWDVAILPFARNEATRYISPTKTLEYLAAGRPVVSTSIVDVVKPFGEQGLVRIADTPDAFVAAIEEVMAADRGGWLERVDGYLAGVSWQRTWEAMRALIHQQTGRSLGASLADENRPVPGTYGAASSSSTVDHHLSNSRTFR
jgi:UDP-galactopyranose mutase